MNKSKNKLVYLFHRALFSNKRKLIIKPQKIHAQFSSVAQSCLTLCDPMNRSTPGLPVHHQLPEFTQTHVHRVGGAIQPSHPLSSPPPAANPSQHQSLFQWVNSSHEVAKVLELNKQGDNIQPWCTPFPVWNQSVVPSPGLTVASWPVYRFLKRQVRWSGMPISFRIFHGFLWSTQSKALA